MRMERFGIVDEKAEAAKRAEDEVGSTGSSSNCFVLIFYHFSVVFCFVFRAVVCNEL